jgi:cytochrome P450 family 144
LIQILLGETIIKHQNAQPEAMCALFDPGVIEDPYPFYRELLQSAPVYQVPGTEVYLVSSWQLIHEVLRNQKDYSANLTGILITDEAGLPSLFDLSQFGGTVDAIANADEPFHAVHKKLVLPTLNARSVSAMEDEVKVWVRAAVSRLLSGGGGDCVAVLANPIPVKVMARLMGLPVEDVDLLLGWAFSGGDILAGTTTLKRMLELAASTGEMRSYLQSHFELAQARGPVGSTGTIIDELVNGVLEKKISDEEAVAIMIVLVGAAGESTSSLVGSAIRLLAEDTVMQEQLRTDSSLIEAYIEEVVRLESPFKGHYRVVLNATHLGGVNLPAGARVFLQWAAANRDPSVFSLPDRLDPARHDGREHIGFGHGIHFCVGARLARMEARIILEELLASTEAFSLSEAEPVKHVPSIFVRRLECLHLAVTPS